jgi:hypothetical protein
VAAGLGVADEVEPVPAPPLAEVRAGEQAVDDLREGVGRGVILEGLDLLRSRREPREVEKRTPEQHALLSRRRGLQALLFQLREDEAVERVLRPGRVLHRRRLVRLDRLPRPVLGFALAKVERFGADGLPPARFALGPRRAPLHPLRQVGDLAIRQLALRGHLEVYVVVVDRLDQPALLRPAGHDGRPVVAALQ